MNHDTIVYQERIATLYRAGLFNWLESRREVSILEIGGGYGALAYGIKSIRPNARYTIVDLPESLLFSALYLSLTRPDERIEIHGPGVVTEWHRRLRAWLSRPPSLSFVPNYMAEHLDRKADLVINTLSFSEMTEHQVRTYARLIRDKWLLPDGILFEQNQDNRHIGLVFAQEIIAEEMPHHRALGRFSQGFANLWGREPLPPSQRN